MGMRNAKLWAAAPAPRLLLLLLLLACCAMVSSGGATAGNIYKKTFRSPSFTLGPGDVVNSFEVVEMPKGHIAIRKFDAEVVDVDGNSIPLYETYLHHWILERYNVPKQGTGEGGNKRRIQVPNAGICKNRALPQMFGLGSETRRTNTTIPPPYGIVVGDPESIPEGYDEVWVLNVHAIDTRGAVDVRGCTECLCALYNVTKDDKGRPLAAGYEGGLECCHDGGHCAVRPEFQQGDDSSSSKRIQFMEYTVTWVDMSDEVIPVNVYILDITDRSVSVDDEDESHWCQVEYDVPKCAEGASKCIHTAYNEAFLPVGGNVIYAVAHQHAGGLGSTLHNGDGEEICSSFPIYGDSNEAANEDGYIVGMTTCDPEPGSVKIRSGEKLHMTSTYNNVERHTGVMGLFYLLVAEPQSVTKQPAVTTNMVLVAVTIMGTVFLSGVIFIRLRTSRTGGYEALGTNQTSENPTYQRTGADRYATLEQSLHITEARVPKLIFSDI